MAWNSAATWRHGIPCSMVTQMALYPLRLLSSAAWWQGHPTRHDTPSGILSDCMMALQHHICIGHRGASDPTWHGIAETRSVIVEVTIKLKPQHRIAAERRRLLRTPERRPVICAP